jgi:hypothetical protein
MKVLIVAICLLLACVAEYRASFCSEKINPVFEEHDRCDKFDATSCNGTRTNKLHKCGFSLYRCKRCSNVGCNQSNRGACSSQGFYGGACLKCGSHEKSSLNTITSTKCEQSEISISSGDEE